MLCLAEDPLDVLDTRDIIAHVAQRSSDRNNYTQMMGKEAEQVLREWNKIKPPAP